MGLTSSTNQRVKGKGMGVTFEGNAQFEEFGDDFGEVFEEFVIVVGIGFNPFLHYLVLIISSCSGSESVPERENNRLATS
jgi:hypothetical protein